MSQSMLHSCGGLLHPVDSIPPHLVYRSSGTNELGRGCEPVQARLEDRFHRLWRGGSAQSSHPANDIAKASPAPHQDSPTLSIAQKAEKSTSTLHPGL